jgi:hypothetical protein
MFAQQNETMERDETAPLPPAPDPAFATRILAGMPPDLAARFDARMLFAVQQAVGGWDGLERRRGRHMRIALPFGVWRVTLVRESGGGRRTSARSRSWLLGAAGLALAALLGGLAVLALT